MLSELSSMLHGEISSDSSSTEFYQDDLAFNKPMPVQVRSPCEQFSKLDSCELYNLDQQGSPQSESSQSDSSRSDSTSDSQDFYRDAQSYNYTYSDLSSDTYKSCIVRNTCLPSNGYYTNVSNSGTGSEHCGLEIKSEPHWEDEPTSKRFTFNNNNHIVHSGGGATSVHPCGVPEDIGRQLLKEFGMEVGEVCRQLQIDADPMLWSPRQTHDWVRWQCRHFHTADSSLEEFYIPGSTLCAMSESELRTLVSSETTSHIKAKLDIWLWVIQQTTQSFAPALTQIPVPRSPTISPTPLSASPCEGMGEEESFPSHSHVATGSTDADRLPDEPVHHHRQTIQLWQFLKLLLLDGGYTDCIRWMDKSKGIFKIENSNRVARLWGKRKNRPAMNYDKLSRSIRQYYKKNIIKKTEHSKRLVYQFCK
ncbi:DNA-binding protein D-ETS-4-like isoform X2 [Dreissena polymorpha]|nr:DNA-binding protein D-ETS-4-like isoform X2 [Dreissena polymorpha]